MAKAKKYRRPTPVGSEFGVSRKAAALACFDSFMEAGCNPSLRKSEEAEGGARYWVSIEHKDSALPDCERYPRWTKERVALGLAVRHALESEVGQ